MLRNTRASNAKRSVDEKAIIFSGLGGISSLAGQQGFSANPLVITKGVGSNGSINLESLQCCFYSSETFLNASTICHQHKISPINFFAIYSKNRAYDCLQPPHD